VDAGGQLAGIDGETFARADRRRLMSAYEDLDLQQRMLLTFEVEEFLYREASLLDERRLDDWLALCTDDIHYWMPIRRTMAAKEIDNEFTKPGGMAYFDDDKRTLALRIQRLAVGRAWAEDPPSRTRHTVTNVRIVSVNTNEILVALNFHLYRTRLDSEEDSWIGRREDLLRRENGALKLARRYIYLDQTVILSQNMSNLF
jgi:3-phenylpropionate/cinnamic acid dioxygenase small subunit